MSVYEFSGSPVLQDHMLKLRDEKTSDSKIVAYHVRKIGKLLFYEAARFLPTILKSVTTPTGYRAEGNIPVDNFEVETVLRASVPFADAVRSEMGGQEFFSVCKRDENTLEPKKIFSYPGSVDGKVYGVLDPMIATAGTVIAVAKDRIAQGKPKELFFMGIFASPVGIENIQDEFGKNVKIFCGSIDNHYEKGFIGHGLNNKGYIIPGAGDMGDRLFGKNSV